MPPTPIHGLSARRFYQAFYRWTILTAPVTKQPHHLSRHIYRRPLSGPALAEKSNAHSGPSQKETIPAQSKDALAESLEDVLSLAESAAPRFSQNEEPVPEERSPEDSTSKVFPAHKDIGDPQVLYSWTINCPDTVLKRKLFGILSGRRGDRLQQFRRRFKCKSLRLHSAGYLSVVCSSTVWHRLEPELNNQIRKICDGYGYPRFKPLVYKESEGRRVSRSARLHEKKNKISESMRLGLRSLTHPVAVITTLKPGIHQHLQDPIEELQGVTVSSFTSVTLDPEAIICFNIKIPSRSWDAINWTGEIRVHILAANAEGARIADVFAGRAGDEKKELARALHEVGAEIDIFEDAFAPEIIHRKAIIGNLRAKVVRPKCVFVGDHVIVIARVTEVLGFGANKDDDANVETGGDTASAPAPEARPSHALSYSDRAYRLQGERIPERTESLAEPEAAPTLQFVRVGAPYTMAQMLEAPRGSRAWNTAPHSRTNKRVTTLDQPVQSTSEASPSSVPGSIRHFHSSAIARSASKLGPSTLTDIVHPDALGKTVADFLGLPDDNKHPFPRPPRMRDLLKALRNSQWASQRLDKHSSGEVDLAPDKIDELERTIATTEHRIAKTLAYTAALDLRLMLDKGRVDFSRAAFLENTIERGMVATIEDAKLAKAQYDQGKINGPQFKQLKEKLLKEHNVLEVETRRLQDLVINDDDDY